MLARGLLPGTLYLEFDGAMAVLAPRCVRTARHAALVPGFLMNAGFPSVRFPTIHMKVEQHPVNKQISTGSLLRLFAPRRFSSALDNCGETK